MPNFLAHAKKITEKYSASAMAAEFMRKFNRPKNLELKSQSALLKCLQLEFLENNSN